MRERGEEGDIAALWSGRGGQVDMVRVRALRVNLFVDTSKGIDKIRFHFE